MLQNVKNTNALKCALCFTMAKNMYLFLLIVSSGITICQCITRLTKYFPADHQIINIVGLFGENEEDDKTAFESAVDDVNRDDSILKKIKLQAHSEIVDLKNAYMIGEKLCAKVKNGTGITAVFGANSEEGIAIIQSVTNFYKIPYLFSAQQARMYNDSNSINMFPQMKSLTQGVVDIIRDMDWVSFTLLYEMDEDLIIFQDLLIKHNDLKDEENFGPIILKQLPDDDDYGPLLKEIHNSSETRILLSCSVEKILPILRKATDLGLKGDYYAYVIISLDAHVLDFKDFIEYHTNITILNLIDPYFYNKIASLSELNRGSTFLNHYLTKSRAQTLLTYDSVYLFARGLDNFLDDDNEKLNEITLDCDSATIFEDGPSLITSIKTTESHDVTGPVKINENGERVSYVLQIIQQSPKEKNILGTWDPYNKIKYTRNITQMIADAEELIANKTFIVSSILVIHILQNWLFREMTTAFGSIIEENILGKLSVKTLS